MTRREYKGGAAPLVLSGNIAASGVTTINTTGTVTAWPTGGTGKFLIVIDRGLASEEKIYCTSRTSNALAVASDADRGADGTSAASHTSGASVEHCGGAIDLDEPNAHINLTAQDDHTQYLNVTRHDITARHVFGSAFATPSTPTDVDPTVSASIGSASGPPHSDHTHGLLSTMPRGKVARATTTGAQSISTTTTDITSLTVTFTAVASRLYKVTLWVPVLLGTLTAPATISLQEGSTVLAAWNGFNPDSGSGFNDTANVTYTSTFSAASHTLKATGIQNGGSGHSMTVEGAATNPCLLLVEDIGL